MNDIDYDFEFNKRYDNYPPSRTPLGGSEMNHYLRRKFTELCYIILYSDDKRKVYNAYNAIFTEYRPYLLRSSDVVKVSVFEDVILKIINDANAEGIHESYGVQNDPFIRYVALIKEYQDPRRLKVKTDPKREFNPLSYLLFFMDGCTDKIKNEQIRNLINKNFSAM